jgi:hypothetical protein
MFARQRISLGACPEYPEGFEMTGVELCGYSQTAIFASPPAGDLGGEQHGNGFLSEPVPSIPRDSK